MTEQLSGSSALDLLHEVRTAINHILGYSAILLDSAQEHQLAQLLPVLEAVHADGIELLERVQAHQSGIGIEAWTGLETEFRPVAARILSVIEDLALPASHAGMLEDAEVVANACRRLLALVALRST
jgi:hypothetical protein